MSEGNDRNLDQLIDRTLEQIREDRLDPATESKLANQAWARVADSCAHDAQPADSRAQIEHRSIRSCADFQALIPAYVARTLPDARSLLIEDHTSECVPCRRALKQARTAALPSSRTAPTADRSGWFLRHGWKIAAAAVLFVAVIGVDWNSELFAFQTGGVIDIESVQGEVFQISDEGVRPVVPGDRINFADVSGLRTGRGSSAILRLPDASAVEMSERAELAVHQRRRLWTRGQGDSVVSLNRGSIIVEASEQGSGHLYVDTVDCDVAVTGTVFAVNRGTKGARVSVLEGSVEVDNNRSGASETLRPGQQTTTSPDVGRVPLEDEFAWSQNVERHIALLTALADATEEIAAQIDRPEQRYSTELLDVAPEDTVIYIGVPNIAGALTQAYDLLQDKIAANEVLSDWWDESMIDSGADRELAEAMERVRMFGEHVGDEVTLAIQQDAGGGVKDPVILARLTSPDSFPAFVQHEIQSLNQETQIQILPRRIETYLPSLEAPDLYLWIADDLMVASTSIERLQAVSDVVDRRAEAAFRTTAFHEKLSELYSDGVQWVVGVDIATMMETSGSSRDGEWNESMEKMGFNDLRHLLVEHMDLPERSESRVVLTFDDERQGIAAWLAEPAPMGTLEFISSEATLAAAFVTEQPSTMLDQFLNMVEGSDGNVREQLEQFRLEHGIDIREDLAAALGSEFAVAIDGPVLPAPSWKVIFEVYNPTQLQATIEQAVAQVNEVAENEVLSLTSAESGGRTYHELEFFQTGLSAHYTFVDGYLVAAVSRPILNRALQVRELGIGLADSPKFTELMPRDGQVNFSGVFYTHLGPVLAPFANGMGNLGSALSAEQSEMLEGLAKSTHPSLIAAYGEPDQITIVNTSSQSLVASALTSVLRLDALQSVQQLLGHAARDGRDDGGRERSQQPLAPRSGANQG